MAVRETASSSCCSSHYPLPNTLPPLGPLRNRFFIFLALALHKPQRDPRTLGHATPLIRRFFVAKSRPSSIHNHRSYWAWLKWCVISHFKHFWKAYMYVLLQNQNLSLIRSSLSCWTASSFVAQWLKRQEKTRITHLPYEILLIIIQALDDQSSARLVQTCHFFRNLVEPHLYCHIRVFRSPEEEMSNPLKSHLLHRTLAEQHDLLPVILSYHGPLVPDVDVFKRIAYRETVRRKSLWLRMNTPSQATMKALTFHECLEIAKIIFSKTANMQELHFTDGVKHCMHQVLGSLDAPESKMMNL